MSTCKIIKKLILTLYLIMIFYCSDNQLKRVLTLLDHIQTAFEMHFKPYETIFVDERMVASKTRFQGWSN